MRISPSQGLHHGAIFYHKLFYYHWQLPNPDYGGVIWGASKGTQNKIINGGETHWGYGTNLPTGWKCDYKKLNKYEVIIIIFIGDETWKRICTWHYHDLCIRVFTDTYIKRIDDKAISFSSRNTDQLSLIYKEPSWALCFTLVHICCRFS